MLTALKKDGKKSQRIKKVLVANRSEIAIRIFRACIEEGIKTVAIYTHEDRFSLHRFKADEAYQIGQGGDPVKAYLDVPNIIKLAKEIGADAIHPGYGFLSESPEFAGACEEAGLVFVGPSVSVLTTLGDKVSARLLAQKASVPTVPASGDLDLTDKDSLFKAGRDIGYPVMCKAAWGGGGRGMRVVRCEEELLSQVTEAHNEAKTAFGKGDVYLEKLVEKARHVEVQILGDSQGQVLHLFERDCSVQRRHQKVVEIAPASWMPEQDRHDMHEAALRIAREVSYVNAGTVEFLYDLKDNKFYFIEVNPRIQVEHTVTEEVTGVDLIKAQLRIAQGQCFGEEGLPTQEDISCQGVAIQCRVTTEDPENNFMPNYGRISAYRSATGHGIRLDGGTAFSGALIPPYFDSLLVKVTATAQTRDEAIARMRRALNEFRVRGVKTNLTFLDKLLKNSEFVEDRITTDFIDRTPELLVFEARRDRATKLLSYLGGVLVNGHPEVKGRSLPQRQKPSVLNTQGVLPDTQEGTRELFLRLGAEKFMEWVKDNPRLLVTDTSFRDGHQSLLATRVRTKDLVSAAPFYEQSMKNLFSMEVWGGATFDVAYRFLKEDPWDRLSALREAVPSVLFQMLLRGSNAVGYTSYPDNVVRRFIEQAAHNGMDVFRVFDSLNWIENMRVSMDAVLETGKILEATLCYTSNVLDPAEQKYTLKYYVSLAKELEKAGAHILAIKDMAGLCRPEAIKVLTKAIKEEVSLPLHFHTHDTSGGAMASLLSASEAGIDVVDAAIGGFSGTTSQPNMGTLVAMTDEGARPTGLSSEALEPLGYYFDSLRKVYSPFQSNLASGTSDVYHHEMPGGQYTNLQQQARSLGIEERWPEVVEAYSVVNDLFGSLIKVTPSSKVVGDMALMMVSQNLTAEMILDPEQTVSFPESVVSFFRGELGQPVGGFPKELQKKVLRGEKPLTETPSKNLSPVDFEATKKELQDLLPDRKITDNDVLGYLLYPKPFLAYAAHHEAFSDTSLLETDLFFYGPEEGKEVFIDLSAGKRLFVRTLAVGEVNEKGKRALFFELNGQPRTLSVVDTLALKDTALIPKAEVGNSQHVGAPMSGMLVAFLAKEGEEVQKGDPLFTLEAMKMESTVYAEHAGRIEKWVAAVGQTLEAEDLVLSYT